MDWKIGEIKQINGEWYQCVLSSDCPKCDLKHIAFCRLKFPCESLRRNDCEEVIFKKLEKIGASYMLKDKKFQKYRVFRTPYIYNKIDYSWQSFADPYYISLEIKEDMEEKKIQLSKEEYDYVKNGIENHILPGKLHKEVYEDEVTEQIMRLFSVDADYSHSEKIETNLRSFDLQKAREGKPVCTRDGRKVRIICFDRISGDDYYKIVACVTAFDGDFEEVLFYGIDGYIVDSQNPKGEDLMMLPEKKEGWVNIYALNTCYSSKEEAEANIDRDYEHEYVRTVKIEWEE